MSDAVLLAIIGIVAMVCKELLDIMRARTLATKVLDTGRVLAAKTQETANDTNRQVSLVHDLVNGASIKALEINAVLARRIYELTGAETDRQVMTTADTQLEAARTKALAVEAARTKALDKEQGTQP